jgi:hypothetical protein
MKKQRQQYYEVAANEILRKDRSPGVWGMAFSEAMGDRDKAVALYIKLRVQQLEEHDKAELVRRRKVESMPQRVQHRMKCENPECNYEGGMTRESTIDNGTSFVLLLLGVIPGLIYIWSGGYYYTCPKCGMRFRKGD